MLKTCRVALQDTCDVGNSVLEGMKNIQEALTQSVRLYFFFFLFKGVFFWNLAVCLCGL